MSVDVVDDLHAAEDEAGSMAACLEEIVAHHAAWLEAAPASIEGDAAATALDEALARARQLIAGWADYCRPGCGAEGDPESDACTDDTCGCPCGHVQ